jgi:hypothetical protein
LADWRIGGLADWRIGGLADWRIGGLADWRIGGLATLAASGKPKRFSIANYSADYKRGFSSTPPTSPSAAFIPAKKSGAAR